MADPIRAELEALITAYDKHGGRWPQHDEDALRDAVERARAALSAQPPAPALDPPLDLDALLSPEGAYERGTGNEDGAQLLTGRHGDREEWWAPIYGCDTLGTLLDRILERILPHLRPPIAGIDVPGGDGDYGGLQELCDAEGVDVRIGAPLLRRAREAWKVAAQPPVPAPEIPEEVHSAFAELERKQENLSKFRSLRESLAVDQPPAVALTFLDAIRLANGCHDYSGGYVGEGAEAFHAGISTVAGVLKKAAAGPWDSQTSAVFAAGAEPINQPPAPAPASDGEREGLAGELEVAAVTMESEGGDHEAAALTRAATLLRTPAPAAVPAELVAIRYYHPTSGVTIERVRWEPDAWAVRCGSERMSVCGEWSIEPSPSERFLGYLAEHSFSNPQAALEVLQQQPHGGEVQ